MGVLNVTPDSFSDGGRYTDLEAGATVVNDVSGGLADPEMGPMVAEAGCPWILMHWRGHSRAMQDLAVYDDVVAEVRAELLARLAAAVDAGVAPERLVLDPGLGFAKRAEHNWALSAHLDRLRGLGPPVPLRTSREPLLGRV